MTHTTLIDAAALQALLRAHPAPVLLDCGFDLADTAAGERAYAAGHLPGAIYAHLDRDLSGAKTGPGPGSNGRHPLPERAALAATLGRWGVVPGAQVVCCDDHGGVYAARAWWLLQWMGHGAVAVLDGGRAAWLAAGGLLDTAPAAITAAPPYPERAPAMPTVDATTLLGQLERLGQRPLLDARAPERFRGEVEPLDPVAGHIPGAACRFFKLNLGPDGRFKPREQLRAEFEALGAGAAEGEGAVHQCGSGVTACHNLLAMAHAGLPPGALYPGSWSEWCSDPARPVAKG
jgi:thiosulfate/3-mercaptopyruvate sulfurtransferase